MMTHDEETKKFFKYSSVMCVLAPRYASSKMSFIKQQVVGTVFTHHQKCVVVDIQASDRTKSGNDGKLQRFQNQSKMQKLWQNAGSSKPNGNDVNSNTKTTTPAAPCIQTANCNKRKQKLEKVFHLETALIHAARQGHTATAKYLIDHGADPTIASNLGATALHHSAGMGDIELLEHLPSKGIIPDLESDAGTPLPIRVELDLLEWLKPYTDVTIVELGKRGVKSLLAVPISFVSEHIETLEEIDVEYKEVGTRYEVFKACTAGDLLWTTVEALRIEKEYLAAVANFAIKCEAA
ncbi:hypothetical protein KIW84_014389 [Lathyrus oleraceus]|uniref:Uncharacterized protein n=1 Tax=Pisum sativum TaxID=3888 RepID=A0A9D5GZG7_PEA|nr:hypothetical protein KIW84_014388 [Pisum sativum]KAI5446525.1 hypothetical protein KIW84_014389 [Pisum sativum]